MSGNVMGLIGVTLRVRVDEDVYPVDRDRRANRKGETE